MLDSVSIFRKKKPAVNGVTGEKNGAAKKTRGAIAAKAQSVRTSNNLLRQVWLHSCEGFIYDLIKITEKFNTFLNKIETLIIFSLRFY